MTIRKIDVGIVIIDMPTSGIKAKTIINTVHKTTDEIPQNIIVKYNKYYNNKYGIAIEGEDNLNIFYNLIFLNKQHGIYLEKGTHAEIYNNVLYNNNTTNTDYRYNLNFGTSNISNVTVKNNILVNTITSFASINIPTISGLTIDYNCYYANGGRVVSHLETHYNENQISVYQSASGLDSHSFAQNPKLKDASNGDFSLDALSPCKDAGTGVVLNKDFNGTAVPQGNQVDIGAFELQGVSSPSKPKNFRIMPVS